MIDMIPTLKTRNTRICILLGQKDQRMGMLTLHDAERLQARSLSPLNCSFQPACFPFLTHNALLRGLLKSGAARWE